MNATKSVALAFLFVIELLAARSVAVVTNRHGGPWLSDQSAQTTSNCQHVQISLNSFAWTTTASPGRQIIFFFCRNSFLAGTCTNGGTRGQITRQLNYYSNIFRRILRRSWKRSSMQSDYLHRKWIPLPKLRWKTWKCVNAELPIISRLLTTFLRMILN